jgi:hypothetical protein
MALSTGANNITVTASNTARCPGGGRVRLLDFRLPQIRFPRTIFGPNLARAA